MSILANKNKPKLVIDASFWINVVFLGLEYNLINYFEIYFVSKVEKEILNENILRLYESLDVVTYLKFKKNNFIRLKNPISVSKKLIDNLQNNSGELFSLALSIELDSIFATDDKGSIIFCNKNNLKFISIVDYILLLFYFKELNKLEVNNFFKLLSGRIKQEYINIARKKINLEVDLND